MGGINNKPFIIWLVDEDFQQSFPEAPIPSTAESTVDVFPITQIWWQISPGSAGSRDPEEGVEKKPIVRCWPADMPLASRKMGLQGVPKGVREVVAAIGLHGGNAPF